MVLSKQSVGGYRCLLKYTGSEQHAQIEVEKKRVSNAYVRSEDRVDDGAIAQSAVHDLTAWQAI